MFDSNQFFSGGAEEFYSQKIDQSLRFNNDDTAYLTRTNATSDDDDVWSWSAWVKRGHLGTTVGLFSAGSYSSPYESIYFSSGDLLEWRNDGGAVNHGVVRASGVFRDPSAWYHIVVVRNGGTVTIYVNGEDRTTNVSSITASTRTMNDSGALQRVGAHERNRYPFDGYLAEVHFTDGTAYDADAFGELKSGVWVAKTPSVTYGTNGFYLDFANSADIGNDISGEGNDWTPNNLTASDVVLDSPTNNFSTLNPLGTNDISTFSQGNLQITTGSGASTSGATMGMSSGKWYAEFVCTAKSSVNFGFGLIKANTFDGDNQLDEGNNVGYFWVNNATVYHGFASDSYGATVSIGDVVGIAFDADTLALQWYKNGVGQGNYTRVASENTAGDHWIFGCGEGQGGATATFVANFGQDSSFVGNKTAQGNSDENGYGDFYYSPPSGYLALCTANLPVAEGVDPALDASPQDYFNTVLWNGNGTSQSITGVGFQPDFVWIKSRSGSFQHHWKDVLRGTTKRLSSSETNAEETNTNSLTSFDADGYSLGLNTEVNGGSTTYVGWNWKANGSGVSNTDGSITSTVSANTTSGFSIVSYVGNAAASTVGHGLGVAPDVIITKSRSSARPWIVYHSANTSAPETDYLRLNETNGTADYDMWNDTAPTSSVFSISSYDWVNNSGDNFIAYCFHSVEGFSKFGSYTGNGSADGPFVYTGFRPAFLILKRTDSANNWVIYDTQRNTFNVSQYTLRADDSSAEGSNNLVDILSNGFKLRDSGGSRNASGGTYIYMAFAENPFKYSNAR